MLRPSPNLCGRQELRHPAATRQTFENTSKPAWCSRPPHTVPWSEGEVTAQARLCQLWSDVDPTEFDKHLDSVISAGRYDSGLWLAWALSCYQGACRCSWCPGHRSHPKRVGIWYLHTVPINQAQQSPHARKEASGYPQACEDNLVST